MTVSRTSGGAALVRALVAHGTELVFGIPGTHNLGIYQALAEHDVKHVTPRHEQGAGFAADGYARVSGKPGVCLTTSGPAVLNAMTAVTQSYSDSVPVLLVSPGMPLRHPGRGNGTLHEVRHQSAALEAVIGYSNRVHSVAEIPLAVAQAFAHMTSGRPRPAHLEIPLDLVDAVEKVIDVAPVLVAHPPADAVTIAAAAGRLNSATRPGLIIGGGAKGAAEEITALAQRLGAPVVATANGKGTFSERHPLSIGAGLHHRAVAEFVTECDVVLAIGTELASTDLWNGPLKFAGDLIRIDVDPVLDNDEHLVITGGPGQGKSTLTLQLTADISKAWSNRDDGQAPIGEPVLPLRIPARVLAAHLGLSISQTLASSASAEYGHYLSGPLEPALFAHRVAGCRWLLLIDALDEVADSESRARIVHTLAAWACKDAYRVLLTTRPAEGGTLAPLQRAGAARYELLPFDEEALRKFAEHWFEDEDQARTFLREIRDAHLSELVAVPLLATIAAIVFDQHDNRPLPGDKYHLYESYLAFIRSSRPVPQTFERHRTALVEHLGRTRLRSDIPLTAAVRDWAADHPDAGTEDELITYLTAAGPFIPRGGDLAFLHHSFAEHVAATADARDLASEFNPEDTVVAELLHQAQPLEEGRFARSVLLHCTHLYPHQADELLHWLHNGASEQHLLAARLLGQHLPASAPVVDVFLAIVRGWAMTTQFRAGLILARASRATHQPGLATWLAGLLADEEAPWESRAEAATALAVRLSDPRAGDAIAFLRAGVENQSAPSKHRLVAAEALADSSTAERDAAERGLRSVLDDPFASGADRHGAAVVLSAFGGEAREYAVAALQRVLSDVDVKIVDLAEAAVGLAEIGLEFHSRCAEVLLSVLRDRAHSTEGRRQAAAGLASVGESQPAEDALVTFIRDRRVMAAMRSNAAATLASLGPRQRAVAGELLLAQLGDGPSERRIFTMRLSGLVSREVAVEHLRTVLRDPATQWGEIVDAAEELAGLGPAFHDEAAGHLQRVLAHTDRSRYTFVACLRALANLGEPHRGNAIAQIRAALLDLGVDPANRCFLAGGADPAGSRAPCQGHRPADAHRRQ